MKCWDGCCIIYNSYKWKIDNYYGYGWKSSMIIQAHLHKAPTKDWELNILQLQNVQCDHPRSLSHVKCLPKTDSYKWKSTIQCYDLCELYSLVLRWLMVPVTTKRIVTIIINMGHNHVCANNFSHWRFILDSILYLVFIQIWYSYEIYNCIEFSLINDLLYYN